MPSFVYFSYVMLCLILLCYARLCYAILYFVTLFSQTHYLSIRQGEVSRPRSASGIIIVSERQNHVCYSKRETGVNYSLKKKEK